MKKIIKSIEFTWEESTSISVNRRRSRTPDETAAIESDESGARVDEKVTDAADPECIEALE